jgi:polyisoprenyl-phosphate glycosyltransferase
MNLSIVIPVYQAYNMLNELVNRIISAVGPLVEQYQIILVDDFSTDQTWQKISDICDENSNVIGLKLSRNFGQHYAITAGLDNAIGQWVVVMDCDLQDVPEEIPKLYAKANEGFDIVFARRNNRTDKFLKILFARLFYKVYSYLTGMKNDGSVANFGIYHKKVIDNIRLMREPMRAFFPMVHWVGFKSSYIYVQHGKRLYGKPTYNFRKSSKLASEVMLSYSEKPLRLITQLGFLISLISFFIGFYYLVQYVAGKTLVSGYTSIIISIWFLGGLIILFLGVLGLYISKIFAGIKNRPLYIIDQKINC